MYGSSRLSCSPKSHKVCLVADDWLNVCISVERWLHGNCHWCYLFISSTCELSALEQSTAAAGFITEVVTDCQNKCPRILNMMSKSTAVIPVICWYYTLHLHLSISVWRQCVTPLHRSVRILKPSPRVPMNYMAKINTKSFFKAFQEWKYFFKWQKKAKIMS